MQNMSRLVLFFVLLSQSFYAFGMCDASLTGSQGSDSSYQPLDPARHGEVFPLGAGEWDSTRVHPSLAGYYATVPHNYRPSDSGYNPPGAHLLWSPNVGISIYLPPVKRRGKASYRWVEGELLGHAGQPGEAWENYVLREKNTGDTILVPVFSDAQVSPRSYNRFYHRTPSRGPSIDEFQATVLGADLHYRENYVSYADIQIINNEVEAQHFFVKYPAYTLAIFGVGRVVTLQQFNGVGHQFRVEVTDGNNVYYFRLWQLKGYSTRDKYVDPNSDFSSEF